MTSLLLVLTTRATPAPDPTPLPIHVISTDGYDWGNLLVQAVIAALTLGTLVWAVKTGRDEAQRASRDRQEALASEERQQASRVSAWERQWVCLPSGEPPSPEAARYAVGDDALVERRALYALNGSDAPIFDVAVRYIDASTVRDGSSGNDVDLLGTWFHSILPPSPSPREHAIPLIAKGGALSEDFVLEVEFADSSGRFWLRDRAGDLHRRRDLDMLTPEQRRKRRMIESEGSDGVDWDPVPGDPDYVA